MSEATVADCAEPPPTTAASRNHDYRFCKKKRSALGLTTRLPGRPGVMRCAPVAGVRPLTHIRCPMRLSGPQPAGRALQRKPQRNRLLAYAARRPLSSVWLTQDRVSTYRLLRRKRCWLNSPACAERGRSIGWPTAFVPSLARARLARSGPPVPPSNDSEDVAPERSPSPRRRGRGRVRARGRGARGRGPARGGSRPLVVDPVPDADFRPAAPASLTCVSICACWTPWICESSCSDACSRSRRCPWLAAGNLPPCSASHL